MKNLQKIGQLIAGKETNALGLILLEQFSSSDVVENATAQVMRAYYAKGWNSAHVLGRKLAEKHGLSYRLSVQEHGLHTNKGALLSKAEAMQNLTTFHYYSYVTKAKNGYAYNVLRTQTFFFEQA